MIGKRKGRAPEPMRLALLLVVVALAMLGIGARPPAKVVSIPSTEDTYVVADTSDESDPQGLRDQVLGGLDFIRTWYVWQVLGSEKVVAVGLVKFDLASLRNKEIKSAHLQLFSTGATLRQPARLVDVHLIASDVWSQNTVSYNSRPAWDPAPVATTAVYGPGVWYSWDVTGSVLSRVDRSDSVSFTVALRSVEDKSEEQVLFASREVEANAPRLLVTYDAPGGVRWYYIAIGIGGALILVLIAYWLGRRMSRRPVASARTESDGAGSQTPEAP